MQKRVPVESVVSGLRLVLMHGGWAILVAMALTLALCTRPSYALGPGSVVEKGLPLRAQESSCRCQAGPHVPAEHPRVLLPLLASFPACSAGPERVPPTDVNVCYALLEA